MSLRRMMILSVLALTALPAATTYTAQMIPASFAFGMDLSNTGVVAGLISNSVVGTYNGTTTSSYTLPSVSFFYSVYVNDAGTVATTGYNNATQGFLGAVGTAGVFQTLVNGSSVGGIDNAGRIAGTAQSSNSAALWAPGGQQPPLLFPALLGFQALSRNGSRAAVPFAGGAAIVDTATGNLLAFVPTGGGSVYAVNDSGASAGFIYPNQVASVFFADSAGNLTILPSLPGFAMLPAWRTINNSGQVVGTLLNGSNHAGGFIWDSVNGTRNLALLTTNFSPTTVGAINDHGQILAYGWNYSTANYGWAILSPDTAVPEPSTLWITAFPVGLWCWRRRAQLR